MSNNCEEIYQQYLVAKENLSAQINGPETMGTYKVIDYKDAMKPQELARELVNNCEDFLKQTPGLFKSVQLDANEVCNCGHSRESHNGLQRFNDGDPIPKHEKDGKCRVNECECKRYIS